MVQAMKRVPHVRATYGIEREFERYYQRLLIKQRDQQSLIISPIETVENSYATLCLNVNNARRNPVDLKTERFDEVIKNLSLGSRTETGNENEIVFEKPSVVKRKTSLSRLLKTIAVSKADSEISASHNPSAVVASPHYMPSIFGKKKKKNSL
jgi:hypothetical protein